MLTDPRLTGLTRAELDTLTAQLGLAQAARAQQRYSEQRGGRRRKATGNLRARPLLDDPARVLITIVYLRQLCSQRVLSDLLEVAQPSIGQAITETRELLDDHGHTVTPTTLRFTTSQALHEFAHSGAEPSRSRVVELLADPTLTGISRTQLHELTDRLAPAQNGRTERARHQRRGRNRLDGTRGGVFRQKITDPERVLVAVLHSRGACTLDVLAELLEVSRSSIGNAVRATRPLLDQDQAHAPAPAPQRFQTTANLLAFLNPAGQDDTQT